MPNYPTYPNYSTHISNFFNSLSSSLLEKLLNSYYSSEFIFDFIKTHPYFTSETAVKLLINMLEESQPTLIITNNQTGEIINVIHLNQTNLNKSAEELLPGASSVLYGDGYVFDFREECF